MKNILIRRGAECLLNLTDDRECVTNLAPNPEYEPQLKALRKTLFEQLKQQRDPRMSGEGAVFDNYSSSRSENGKHKPTK